MINYYGSIYHTHAMNKPFFTKASVLSFLKSRVKYSKIEDLFYFTVSEWNKDSDEIIKTIKSKFHSTVIIRSSAIGEDSVNESHAGQFESILNINPKSKTELINGISLVINSYSQTEKNLNHQILVQNQTKNIKISGVVFTRTPDTGSPYYVINYDIGSSTDGVTKGIINNTIKIFKNTKKIPFLWKNLIISLKELEKILDSDYLDIEFGIITNNKIIIFQARPMSFITSKNLISTKKISKVIQENKQKYSKYKNQRKEFGKLIIFSDMADWNPAEIIGNKPNLLDYSLYNFLIMRNNWKSGREIIDYQKLKNYQLMVKFGNKPYVDIRASFNSMIPSNIPKYMRKKLLNYYYKKLSCKPYLHDKVEFEILFTCFDYSLESRIKELIQFNFTKIEINSLQQMLITFTNNIIKNFPKIFSDSELLIHQLERNRLKLLSDFKKKNQNPIMLLDLADQLLEDCKNLGVSSFSTMARIAFIATSLLKSLEKKQVINSKYFEQFMNSLNTPLSQIKNDTVLYSENKISKKLFLKKYGHLRPGTYDITAKRYDKSDLFNNVSFSKKLSSKTKIKEIDENNLKPLIFDNIGFNEFIKMSIEQREKLKFEFTKNLSDALEFISDFGRQLGFSNDEIAQLDISTIFNYKKLSLKQIKEKWRKKIFTQQRKKEINNHLVLPPIIFSKNDFDIIEYFTSKPNFISSKSAKGEILFFNSSKKIVSFTNKIIVIENADPGYDWILTKNPLGLITKYGGVASHMSIRCAEIGLPAAIGVGEILFEKLTNSIEVSLDCKNEKLEILKSKKHDDEIEIRKTLKSLGYIK